MLRPPGLFKRIETCLQNPNWSRKSNSAIARHLRCDRRQVQKVRVALRLVQPVVEAKSGNGGVRLMRTGMIGRNRGKSLTEAQQRRVDEAKHLAVRLSVAKANNILNQMELEGIANDALMVAAKYWRPDRGYPWLSYASQGIYRAFSRAFKRARQKLQREFFVSPQTNREGEDDGTDSAAELIFAEQPQTLTMVERLNALDGLDRLLIEWISGLDPTRRKWTPRQITEFLGEHWTVELVEARIERAKQTMME